MPNLSGLPNSVPTSSYIPTRGQHSLHMRQYQLFFAFIKAKNWLKKWNKCCNLQGFGAVTGKKLHKYQRLRVQKWPKHRYLQCFVLSTLSEFHKHAVNTGIFCHQPAQNAVIYTVFCCAFKNTGICSVLCISSPKSHGIYKIFCFSGSLSQETSKQKNAVIYNILLLSKSEKLSEKCDFRSIFEPTFLKQKGRFKKARFYSHNFGPKKKIGTPNGPA